MTAAKANEPTAEQIVAQRIYRQFGVSDDEFALIVEFMGRKPNYTEIGVFSVMWSEHCSYKNSKPALRRFPTTGEHVLMGPGEGAGIVDIGDGQAVAFKIESHNHPSAVEPYQGAATGVGGILRDIYSMGARPIAQLNSLRFGPLDNERVKFLFENVVAGIGGYANTIGLPTIGGEIMFDPSYEGNPLVNVMCAGLIDHDQIQRGVAAGIGNPVFYVGPPTGRDGIHGATFSSEEISDETESSRAPVQVGDPLLGKLVMEACLELIASGIVVGIQDMGAAGLTSSSAEMASKAGNGIELYLDEVPQRDADMTAYEMMLSESQERMLFVVRPEDEQQAKDIFAKWGLPCAKVGKVTDDGRLKVFHHGQLAADMPVKALVDDCPVYEKPAQVPAYYVAQQNVDAAAQIELTDLGDALKKVLASPTVASKEWVYRQCDVTAGAETVLAPGQADAGVVRIRGTRKALAMTVDCNARFVYLDPLVGGRIAVAEAARNIVCTGAEPLAVTDNLNFGNPDKPEVFWQLEQAAEGISEACRTFATPVISGNVSLNNENVNGAIFPTPVIGMVGLMKDVAHVTPQAFQEHDDLIILLGETKAEFGGSELQQVLGQPLAGRPPTIDLAVEKQLQETLLSLIQQGLIASAHDLSEGGLATALAESCIGGQVGAKIDWQTDLRADHALFSESQSRVLISLRPEHLATIEQQLTASGVPFQVIGTVQPEQLEVAVAGQPVLSESVQQLEQIWKGAIQCLMT